MNLRFTVGFPEDLLLAIKAEAAAQRVSPSQVIKARLSDSM
jgi:hypothetical protein